MDFFRVKTLPFVTAALLLAFCCFPVAGGKVWAEPGSYIKAGQTAPTAETIAGYHFTGLDGKQLTLGQFRGQTILLNFWATWCGPCVAEMPTLNTLAQHYKGRAFKVLPVSLDSDGAKLVGAFFQRHKLNALTPYLDFDDEAQRLFHLSGVPASYLISPTGKILATFDGQQNWLAPEIQQTIEQALPKAIPGGASAMPVSE